MMSGSNVSSGSNWFCAGYDIYTGIIEALVYATKSIWYRHIAVFGLCINIGCKINNVRYSETLVHIIFLRNGVLLKQLNNSSNISNKNIELLLFLSKIFSTINQY